MWRTAVSALREVMMTSRLATRRLKPRALAGAAMLTLAAALYSGAAHAQAKLDAHYQATLAGLPIGEGTWVIELEQDRYSAIVVGETTGLIKVFTGGQGTSMVRGILSGGQPVSSTYSAQIKTKHKTDDIELIVDEGAVKEFRVRPPIDNDPERVPVKESDRRGVTDPLTASIVHVNGNANPLGPESCQRNLAIFDGRLRYNLKFVFKRMETVHANKGYNGPAVVCTVYFAPVAGFIPSRAAIKYLVGMRDAEVWLAPIAGTRALVPFRVQVPTPLGVGAIEATQFVAIPQPVKASIKGAKANGKSQ
jgi:hypothetical protein